MKTINYKKTKKISKSSTGFAMLFAVLTASLLLTIGISIFNISFKELSISTNTRESQIAFFAADSGRECALYWDLKKGYFPTCLDSNSPCTESTPANGYQLIKCNGVGITINKNPSVTAATTTYMNVIATNPFIKYSADNLDPQADVTITKNFDGSNIVTIISARGHNIGLFGSRLERAIEQTSIR